MMIVSRLPHSIHKLEGDPHSRSCNLATRMLRLLRCMGLLLAHHVITWRRSNFGRFRSEADISGGGVQYRIYDGVDAPPTASMCQ
jgi:hypothetical protein